MPARAGICDAVISATNHTKVKLTFNDVIPSNLVLHDRLHAVGRNRIHVGGPNQLHSQVHREESLVIPQRIVFVIAIAMSRQLSSFVRSGRWRCVFKWDEVETGLIDPYLDEMKRNVLAARCPSEVRCTAPRART